MRSDEIRDAGSLAGTALSSSPRSRRTRTARSPRRLFGLIGPAAAPVRAAARRHQRPSPTARPGSGCATCPQAAGLVGRDRARPDGRVGARRPARAVRARRGQRRSGATASPASTPSLAPADADAPARRAAAPRAVEPRRTTSASRHRPRLVIFAHGLCETDLCWSVLGDQALGRGAARPTAPSCATTTAGRRSTRTSTPACTSPTTGASSPTRSRSSSATWPVPVKEIALVGHSLGGLVVRSAAHQAHEADMAWAKPLRHIVGLGTPHMGAPLERFVNWGTHRLARLPETRPLARSGSTGAASASRTCATARWSRPTGSTSTPTSCCRTASPPPRSSPASPTRWPRRRCRSKPEGLFAHDLLVQHTSAHGKGKVRSIPFDTERTHHIGGKHHFDLLADADGVRRAARLARRGGRRGPTARGAPTPPSAHDGAGRTREDPDAVRPTSAAAATRRLSRGPAPRFRGAR